MAPRTIKTRSASFTINSAPATATRSKTKYPPKPPSPETMVLRALQTLKERNGGVDDNGSSLIAIKKTVAEMFSIDVSKLAKGITTSITQLVESGQLLQLTGTGANGSFKLVAIAKKPTGRRQTLKPSKKASLKTPPGVRSVASSTFSTTTQAVTPLMSRSLNGIGTVLETHSVKEEPEDVIIKEEFECDDFDYQNNDYFEYPEDYQQNADQFIPKIELVEGSNYDDSNREENAPGVSNDNNWSQGAENLSRFTEPNVIHNTAGPPPAVVKGKGNRSRKRKAANALENLELEKISVKHRKIDDGDGTSFTLKINGDKVEIVPNGTPSPSTPTPCNPGCQEEWKRIWDEVNRMKSKIERLEDRQMLQDYSLIKSMYQSHGCNV